jgi:hypothetical protein
MWKQNPSAAEAENRVALIGTAKAVPFPLVSFSEARY